MLCAGAVALNPAAIAQAPQGVETFDDVWRTVRDSHFDQDVQWRELGRAWRPSSVRRPPPPVPLAKCGQCCATCSGGSASRTLRSFRAPPTASPTCRAISSGSAGFDVRLIDRDLVVTEVDPSGAAMRGGREDRLEARQRRPGPYGRRCSRRCRRRSSRVLLQVEAWRLAHIASERSVRDRARTSRSRTVSVSRSR